MRKQFFQKIRNTVLTLGILALAFGVSLLIDRLLDVQSLIPAIFVLAVFLVSVCTGEYLYGVTSAFFSMFAVNFAFTFPYFSFNFSIPENLVSAVIMTVVALLTCTLSIRVKRQELIRAEGEKERLRANLLRAVSHDLRTPLTTIYGSSSALLENADGFTLVQQGKMLQGIKDDAEWLIRMVENLLSITRLDGGNVQIIKTPTVLDELVDAVLVKFQKRYPAQRVQLELPDTFYTIPMDAILIQQVLVNLLENAVQHATGMTELSLRVFVLGNKAIFEITDNGCGIDDARMKNLFTGCGVAEGAPSDGQRRNSGIGLSVCASIIKAHGGDIQAENRKTGGATFHFSLNMEEDTDAGQSI